MRTSAFTRENGIARGSRTVARPGATSPPPGTTAAFDHEVQHMASPYRRFSALPPAAGLYDGDHEHDACGVAFVATMRGEPGHDIVDLALTALRNLDHRGAVGAEVDTGDGAGILTQVPDAFLREVLRESSASTLPPRGSYAVGIAFLPEDDAEREPPRRRRSSGSPPRRA